MREPEEHVDEQAAAEQEENGSAGAELDDEREPSPDFPEVPNRDVGVRGTRDVDLPPNTGDDVPDVG